jgi:hypothetical protein
VRAKRKAIVLVVAIFALAIAAYSAHIATDPLRRSNSEVREWLLEKVPLGSSFEDARAVAIKDHWTITFEVPFNAPSPFMGERWIGYDVGHYGWPFPLHVTSKWRFMDDKLVDIQIEKIGDAI